MLLDSNIIIYASQPHHSALRQFIAKQVPGVSIVSYIEVLGYHRLNEDEQQWLERFFGAAELLPISGDVAQVAISLRRRRRMTVADAIIAATAVAYQRTLVTHNVEDFEWISEIRLLDPLQDCR